MSIRLALAAASAIALASPAFAQDTAAQPPAAATPPEMTPEQAAFSAEAQAFETRMDGIVAQIRALLADTTTNGAQKQAAVDAILASNTPAINAFADTLQGFLTSQLAGSTNPEEQAAIQQALTNGPAGVRSIPDQIRNGVAQAIAQGAAAEGQGATPPPPTSGAVAGTPPPQ